MPDLPKPAPLVFWRSATGREPVREGLKDLSREDKKTIGRDIAKVQFGWPIGLGFHDGILVALQRLKELQSWQERTRT